MFGFKVSDLIVLRPLVQHILNYQFPQRPTGEDLYKKPGLLFGTCIGIVGLLSLIFSR